MDEQPTPVASPTMPSLEVCGKCEAETAATDCSIVIIGPRAAARVHRADTWSVDFSNVVYSKMFPDRRMDLMFWGPNKNNTAIMFQFPPEIKELPEDAMTILLGEEGLAVMTAGQGLLDLRPGCQRLLEAAKSK